MNGLKRHPDVEVIEYPFTSRKAFDNKRFNELSNAADYVYIPPMRHSDVRFIRKKTSKPIVFDPLISKYLTRTIDHGKWWSAPEKYFRDWIAFKNSDLILMDTEGDKEYIVDKYKLDPNNVQVVPIGVDTSIFKPETARSGDKLVVGFHGGFIPLQGVEKIVKAADLLKSEKDIVFDIVGAGSQYKKIRKLANRLSTSNVNFRGWVNYDEINPIINTFDVCLGIFGDSIKTNLVVPNKVYEYAALRKCIITKDTPAIKEIFSGDENIKLCPSDPQAIADAIMELKSDTKTRLRLAENAFELITGSYDEQGIAGIFLDKIGKWQRNRF